MGERWRRLWGFSAPIRLPTNEEFRREYTNEFQPAPLEPINDTWLSGKPYYCNACGLNLAEYLACEDGGCDLETDAQAQARLAKAHAEGKGMPAP